MFDQDFINDGYINQRPLRDRYVCPNCGRVITATMRLPRKDVHCLGRVPRTGPRAKGEPRTVICNAIMVLDNKKG